jgi:hypothetical protein
MSNSPELVVGALFLVALLFGSVVSWLLIYQRLCLASPIL